MKLNSNKLAFSAALITAVLWVVCSILVAMAPEEMMSLSEAMLHIKFHAMSWHIDIIDMVIGGIAWVILVAILVWLTSALYNYFLTDDN